MIGTLMRDTAVENYTTNIFEYSITGVYNQGNGDVILFELDGTSELCPTKNINYI